MPNPERDALVKRAQDKGLEVSLTWKKDRWRAYLIKGMEIFVHAEGEEIEEAIAAALKLVEPDFLN